MRFRITMAIAFAVVGLAALASPAAAAGTSPTMPTTAVSQVTSNALPSACGMSLCLGHGFFVVGNDYHAPDFKAQFIFQNDGNLVDYDENALPRWASHTANRGFECIFQNDGNLVVYNSIGQPLWASRTNGHPNDVLAIQNDGNVVIYNGNTPIWATHTRH